MDLTILYFITPLASGRRLTREDGHLKSDPSTQDGASAGEKCFGEEQNIALRDMRQEGSSMQLSTSKVWSSPRKTDLQGPGGIGYQGHHQGRD